ncbi:MAG TPA: prepilin-type N-terminal cleavage/methylation domain-containing protein [Saccharofermentans sp.]|nr:prepilin-type N-terminal cleavage/methylation domain-containing protein [Saccharofermentans sp.]HUM23588.1 prepilin-type N-terminal cleavage/methylation domain-containing protein [Saccharofermentans sp.]
MIKIYKSKKGFTLLEIVLAVAILMIMSTALVQGFLSTLQYSYDTSLYLRMSKSNYGRAVSDLSNYSNSPVESRYEFSGNATLSIGGAASVAGLDRSLSVYVNRETNTTITVSDIGSGIAEGSSPVSSRRTNVLYTPGLCPLCGRSLRHGTDSNNGNTWVTVCSNANCPNHNHAI